MATSIEDMITGLTSALNRNAAAIEQANKAVGSFTEAAPEKAAETKAATKTDKKAETNTKAADAAVDKQPKITQPQLLAKIKEVATTLGKDVAREQFSHLGYEKMAEIKPEHFDAVFDGCNAKLNAGADEL